MVSRFCAIILVIMAVVLGGHSQQAQVQDEEATTEKQSTAPKIPMQTPELISDIKEAPSVSTNQLEREATQREIDHLAAQQGMDESTRKMAYHSVIQTFLVLIGTIALLITLWLTWRTTRAAVSSVKVSESIGTSHAGLMDAQMRAYITVSSINFSRDSAGKEAFEIVLKNVGQTPARNLQVRFAVFDIASRKFFPLGEIARIFGLEPTWLGDVGFGESKSIKIVSLNQGAKPLDREGEISQLLYLLRQNKKVYFCCIGTYNSITEKKYIFRYDATITGNPYDDVIQRDVGTRERQIQPDEKRLAFGSILHPDTSNRNGIEIT